jgi:transglutaminase-like putative cysteine protease
MIGRSICIGLIGLSTALLPMRTAAQPVTGFVRSVPQGAHVVFGNGGTLVLRGSLTSNAKLTMTGAFSVGHATHLTWDLPRLTTMRANGYREVVRSQVYHFSISPSSSENLTIRGQSVRRFQWDNPPVNRIITTSVQVSLQVRSRLSPFVHSTPYPLQTVPIEVAPYLAVTPSLQLPASSARFVQGLARGQRTEEAVVSAVANWVASHIRYDRSLMGEHYQAGWVLQNQRATCQGFASVTAAILRQLGIPSQVVYGWISATPIRVPGAGSNVIQWSTPGTAGALHDWLNVYFPGRGWVPFEPQLEKFFIDPRHLAFLTEIDASNPEIGAWSAIPTDGLSVTGRPLANGTAEIVPSDAVAGTVRLRTSDSFQLRVGSRLSDVSLVQLLSR